MNNKQISRYIKSFREARDGWLDILHGNPDSVQAAQHVFSINSKIEFLKTLYNYAVDTDDILI
jgi:hypothetical protein